MATRRVRPGLVALSGVPAAATFGLAVGTAAWPLIALAVVAWVVFLVLLFWESPAK